MVLERRSLLPVTSESDVGMARIRTARLAEEEGFTDLHFITLNRADLVYAICRVLGVKEEAQA